MTENEISEENFYLEKTAILLNISILEVEQLRKKGYSSYKELYETKENGRKCKYYYDYESGDCRKK